EEADVVVALGPRLGDVTTAGYTRLRGPEAAQGLVHVHPDPAELGRVYRPALAIAADVTAVAEAMAALPALDPAPWRAWVEAARGDYLAWRTPPEPRGGGGHVDLGAVMVELRRQLPPDAIVASGAGNYTGWVHRFLSFSRFRTQLAPTGGAMGYGFPAALAAKVVHPDREVVAVAGDGCFLMAAQELATAVGADLPVVVLVVNNHAYGTIRLHQERRYPGRPIGTDLHNPDFASYARAFGAYGETVTTTDAFPAALERARGAGRPALLELVVDPEVLTPTTTLADLRAAHP
ncbi:MAG TPA: thiamine pyrophosphate-dependent enzyme, partial [Acidimicrobiales bacterium]|nr:thiamine pyrophosphate-dependent enzyme [Acidimicrobiales bacterium]